MYYHNYIHSHYIVATKVYYFAYETYAIFDWLILPIF